VQTVMRLFRLSDMRNANEQSGDLTSLVWYTKLVYMADSPFSPARDAATEPRGNALYFILRDSIVRGELGPGVRLSEGETSRRFGVSRTPVREALARLHAEGFLEPRGSRTRTQLAVADFDEHQMFDVYDIVGTLEGTAARTIARMSKRTREDIAGTMDHWTARFAAAVASRPSDYGALFQNHGQFHEVLTASCRRPQLLTLLGTVRPLIDRYEYAYAPFVGTDHQVTVQEHNRITAALREGDADGAELAARANYVNGAERLAPAIRAAKARRIPPVVHS
jgi:DNA-binding GntR family transcriptional regulator